MRYAMIVLALLIGGCASFGYQEAPQDDDPIIIQRAEYTSDHEYKIIVQVRTERPEFPRCTLPDAANHIYCKFSMNYLKTGSMLTGINDGWKSLTPQSARNMCNEAMLPTLHSLANGQDVRVCGNVLMYIRFRDLPPDETPADRK